MYFFLFLLLLFMFCFSVQISLNKNKVHNFKKSLNSTRAETPLFLKKNNTPPLVSLAYPSRIHMYPRVKLYKNLSDINFWQSCHTITRILTCALHPMLSIEYKINCKTDNINNNNNKNKNKHILISMIMM